MIAYIPIIVLATIGFFISLHIYRTKKKGAKLVCFIGGGKKTCNEVVESAYAKTFGVPNEVAGMGYYIVIASYAKLLWLVPQYIVGVPRIFPLVLTGVAFFLSLYLTVIQAFVLRKFCEWCLATAVINTIIFGITLLLF